MDEVRMLRHVVYETAGKYHLAHGEFFTCLGQSDKTSITLAAIKARKAGGHYRVALQKLVNQLILSGQMASHREEVQRAQQTLDNLEREMNALAAYRQEEAHNRVVAGQPE